MKIITHTRTTKGPQGEILEHTEKSHAVRSPALESYVMFFLEERVRESGLGFQFDLFHYMLEKCEYNTGTIKITSSDREEILKLFSKTRQSLTSTIKKLLEARLISGSKGTYQLNHRKFWKGELKARRKLLLNFPKLEEQSLIS